MIFSFSVLFYLKISLLEMLIAVGNEHLKKEKKRGTLSIAELEIFINWVSNNLSFSCVEKKNVSLLGVNVGCA